MNPFVAVGLRAREYPQKYHWKMMTLKDIMTTQMRERADFLRGLARFRALHFQGQQVLRGPVFIGAQFKGETRQERIAG